ncbi:hypothetical protein LGQ02_04920 [Bacillus shivajii]|uniref:hypothetical protein n=1 Tax=Bacillus shivajii TaxID=1983719 RepID=UPI001CFBBB8B|nr:hypothetical protein [Bacillus shivajii]UCZ54125.1 hypothetical protein LGQ02_04920 [Bacillus shivajii]
MKYLSLILLVIVTLTACSDTESINESEFDIEGIALNFYYPPEGIGHALIFVEDNLFGSYMKFMYQGEVPEDYLLEAYRLWIPPETDIYSKDTGEKITKEDGLRTHSFEQASEIFINVKEDFESETMNRGGYVVHNPMLLPVYTAKEIYISPPSKEQYVQFHSPVNQGDYRLHAFYEDNSQEIWDDFIEFENKLNEEFNIYHYGRFQTPETEKGIIEMFEIDEYPTFILLGAEGIALKTNDEEDVYDFLAEQSEGE